MVSPSKGTAPPRHSFSQTHAPVAHASAAGAGPAGSLRAYAFAVGMLMVALFSILGIGVSPPFDRGPPSMRAACGGRHVGTGTESPFFDMRNEVYDKMEADFDDKGAEFLFGGNQMTSQSLKISDLFRLEKGEVKPVLKPARPPVRAIILRFSPTFASRLKDSVREHLIHHFPGGVWFQDSELYHSSLFHASNHLTPVAATPKQVQEEVRAVQGISRRLCPPLLSLDRVVLTKTGVLLACWQVLEGTDPAEFRDMLKDALPRAPKKQIYNRVIVHTTLARIVAPPIWPDGTLAHNSEQAMPILRSIVFELNQRLCRLQETVHEMWYVEEKDLLALALDGSMAFHKFNLTCLHPDWTGTV